MKFFIILTFWATSLMAVEKPNIIFVLADDLGWKDLGCTGSTFYETPAIDALAKDGVRFSQAYAPHPVCGPSRAAILSGKSPLRIKNTAVAGRLKLGEKTMAEAFKENGYNTFFTGKWHCGAAPQKQGFDVAIGNNPHGQPGSYYYPYKDTGMDWPGFKRRVIKARDVPGFSDGVKGEYLTDRLTKETLKFIEGNKKSGKPFFVFLSHYAVHAPLESKKKYEEYFRKKAAKLPKQSPSEAYVTKGKKRFKTRQDNAVFAGMIKSLDDSILTLRNYLKENELDKNTIIVFTSDNGGIGVSEKAGIELSTSNLPLRAGKGWCYDGGTRVPLIISYPQSLPKGKVLDTPVIGTDLYPTFLQLSQLELQEKQHKDGVSLVDLMRSNKSLNRDQFCWIFPNKHGSGHRPSAAIRFKDFKLIHHFKPERLELYDLKKDVGERVNLASKKPEMTRELKKRLDNWRQLMKKN